MITNYTELYVAFIILMLISNKLYPTNYYLQAFWIFSGLWIGAISITNATLDSSFIVALLIYNTMLNIFYLNQTLKDRKNRK